MWYAPDGRESNMNQRSLREVLMIFTALAGTCASAEPATRLALVGGMVLDG
jgi:hypothetical protein